ncbi:hypothetical protein KIN20_009905 [Parelaphostrongylus tenuis]|uniref:Uncharacterized protein n=1 Tax=Parelaphostrongylus tenuis TaxID=148309 RepID=A0AAD5QKY7_PARTN|nr:hypothetical protein KIN20_009905 [Parelaphostrongylus tenuis]
MEIKWCNDAKIDGRKECRVDPQHCTRPRGRPPTRWADVLAAKGRRVPAQALNFRIFKIVLSNNRYVAKRIGVMPLLENPYPQRSEECALGE